METEFITSYIGLGSNLGDRAGNLLLAVRGITEAGMMVHKLSAVYETEPVGVSGHPHYLNMIAEVRTTGISVSQMMARLLRIEYQLGRRRKTIGDPRTIDLDLIFFGSEVIDTLLVTVPHPRVHVRRFVLTPMCEIAPDLLHPTMQRTIFELLEACSDKGDVEHWDQNKGIELPLY